MKRKLLILIAGGFMLSGCILITPIALVGPVSQGFSTASLMQTGLIQATNHIVNEKTGKTINGHAWSVVEEKLLVPTIRKVIFKQAYFPIRSDLEIAP